MASGKSLQGVSEGGTPTERGGLFSLPLVALVALVLVADEFLPPPRDRGVVLPAHPCPAPAAGDQGGQLLRGQGGPDGEPLGTSSESGPRWDGA